jgi:hypothetical protein
MASNLIFIVHSPWDALIASKVTAEQDGEGSGLRVIEQICQNSSVSIIVKLVEKHAC